MVTFELNDEELEEIIRQAYVTGLSERMVVPIGEQKILKSRVKQIKQSIDTQIINGELEPYTYIVN